MRFKSILNLQLVINARAENDLLLTLRDGISCPSKCEKCSAYCLTVMTMKITYKKNDLTILKTKSSFIQRKM